MSIVTTFDNQCRALTSAPSPDEDASRFIVGSLNVCKDNLIYIFEYKDDNNNLAKISYRFPYGECWHISTSLKRNDLFAAVTGLNNKLKVSLFRLPQDVQSSLDDDYGLSESNIDKVSDIVHDDINLTRQCHWHPDEGNRLLVCNDDKLLLWDLETLGESKAFSLKDVVDKNSHNGTNSKLPRAIDLRWSSLFNCSVIAAAIGPKIYGFDTRVPDTSQSFLCWVIEDDRCNRIRSIDFNPNSQYYLASGGDDCRANIWDLRQTSRPTIHLQPHKHWIWSVRYNPFHDQLLLSAGSDARVALMRVQSVASEPISDMAEYDDEAGPRGESNSLDRDDKIASTDLQDVQTKSASPKTHKDEVIKVYEEHDDSVYAAEWATDPWIFASLGYESRLIINKVPKAEKFNILF